MTTRKHLRSTLLWCYLAALKRISSQICSMFWDFGWWAARGAAVPHRHHAIEARSLLHPLKAGIHFSFSYPPAESFLFLFSQECALALRPEQRSRNKAHCQRLSHTGGGTVCLDTKVSVFWLFRVERVSTETASAPPLCLFCWDRGPRSRLKIPSLWAEAQHIIGKSLQFDLVPRLAIWCEEELQKRENAVTQKRHRSDIQYQYCDDIYRKCWIRYGSKKKNVASKHAIINYGFMLLGMYFVRQVFKCLIGLSMVISGGHFKWSASLKNCTF